MTFNIIDGFAESSRINIFYLALRFFSHSFGEVVRWRLCFKHKVIFIASYTFYNYCIVTIFLTLNTVLPAFSQQAEFVLLFPDSLGSYVGSKLWSWTVKTQINLVFSKGKLQCVSWLTKYKH